MDPDNIKGVNQGLHLRLEFMTIILGGMLNELISARNPSNKRAGNGHDLTKLMQLRFRVHIHEQQFITRVY